MVAMDWFQQEVTFTDPDTVTAYGEQVPGDQWTVPALVDWRDRVELNAMNAVQADTFTIYIPATVRRPRPTGRALLPDGSNGTIRAVRPWDQLAGFPHVVEVQCGQQR